MASGSTCTSWRQPERCATIPRAQQIGPGRFGPFESHDREISVEAAKKLLAETLLDFASALRVFRSNCGDVGWNRDAFLDRSPIERLAGDDRFDARARDPPLWNA